MTTLISDAFDASSGDRASPRRQRPDRRGRPPDRRGRRARPVARARADAPRGPRRRQRADPRHRRVSDQAARDHRALHEPTRRARPGRFTAARPRSSPSSGPNRDSGARPRRALGRHRLHPRTDLRRLAELTGPAMAATTASPTRTSRRASFPRPCSRVPGQAGDREAGGGADRPDRTDAALRRGAE